MKGQDIKKRRVDLKSNQVNHLEMKRCLLKIMYKKKKTKQNETKQLRKLEFLSICILEQNSEIPHNLLLIDFVWVGTYP